MGTESALSPQPPTPFFLPSLFFFGSILWVNKYMLPAFLCWLGNSHFVYILLTIKLKFTKMYIKVNIMSDFYEEALEFLMLANSV